MNHEMRLDPEPFEKIKSGIKDREIRVNDEKRQAVKVEDTITFSKRPEMKEKLNVKVLSIVKYLSYTELVEKVPLINFSGKYSKEELKIRGSRYSKEKQEKYGFVVFGIKLI